MHTNYMKLVGHKKGSPFKIAKYFFKRAVELRKNG